MNDETNTPVTGPAEMKRTSWNIVVDGVLLVLLAAVLILDPEKAEKTFIGFVGILCILGGGILFARAWTVSRMRSLSPLYWTVAIVPIGVGLILLFWPLQSLQVMIYAVAITFLVRGIVECTLAASNMNKPAWEFLLAHGIIGIVLGIVFIVKFEWAPVLAILFLGVDLIVRGANQGGGLMTHLQKKMDNHSSG
ncbi:MAG: DUF308 domain-containing protein [Planctomycetota bacterium]|nr:DUF308 domain-containing protein [Planctomycetota bacterium]